MKDSTQSWNIELFSGSIPGLWENLLPLLIRFRGKSTVVVYEAGGFGYWLHDKITGWGGICYVTPPSLIPVESGKPCQDGPPGQQEARFASVQGCAEGDLYPFS